MKLISVIVNLILWIWQLPQNILGFFVLWTFGIRGLILKVSHEENWINVYYLKYMKKDNFSQGVSLGNFILIEKDELKYSKEHEIGHSKQSQILGPLYLLVIGLPSFLWAFYYSFNTKLNYYSFYTERWADKLAGIER